MQKFNIGDYVKLSMLDPTYKDYIALSKSIFEIKEIHYKENSKYTTDYYKVNYYSGGIVAKKFLTSSLTYPDQPDSRDNILLIDSIFQDIECVKLQRKDKLIKLQ